MKKKLSRVLSLLLCTIMVCAMMPMEASAAITVDESFYYFTTFKDLKELVARAYEYDDCFYACYDSEEPLIIEESLNIPEKLYLDLSMGKVTVPSDVTLTLNAEVNYFGELIVEGTLINNAEMSVDETLVVNGSLVNNYLLRPGSQCEVTGYERISTGEDGQIWWAKRFTSYSQMKEYLALADAHPEYIYEIYADYETEAIDVHIAEDLTFGSNVWIHGDDNFTLTVDTGYTLTNKASISLNGGTLVVNGTLDNLADIHLGWIHSTEYQYGSLVIGSTGTYTGDGYIVVASGDRTDYRDFFIGLDLSQFDVETEGSEGDYWWWLIPKSAGGSDGGSEDTIGGFTDVEADAYYAEAVLWAVEMGITNGYGSATTFCPDITCTRGQIVTFLWRANGSPEPASLTNPFTDVSADAYYYKAVLWAVENGITAGYGSDDIFNPDGECTRGQVATFLWRAEGKPAVDTANNPFVDVTSDAYYYDAVLWAVGNGVTNGYGSANTFCPDVSCTRGQIVTFLCRAMN